MEEKIIRREGANYQRGFIIITGYCSDNVTKEDIKEQFFHPKFGGREVCINSNRFEVTVNNR